MCVFVCVGESRAGRLEPEEVTPTPSPASSPAGEDVELVEQLRKVLLKS